MMEIRSNEQAHRSSMLGLASGGAVLGLAMLALTVTPAAAQNTMGLLTPFSTSTSPAPFMGPVTGGLGSGGGGSGGEHHDGDDHHHHHDSPFVVFPFWGGTMDDGGTGSVQITPVNTAPFAPPAPPTPGERAPTAPYKPPSVEIAPGGVEIVRGPG